MSFIIFLLLVFYLWVLTLEDGDFLVEHGDLPSELFYLYLELVIFLLDFPSFFGYL